MFQIREWWGRLRPGTVSWGLGTVDGLVGHWASSLDEGLTHQNRIISPCGELKRTTEGPAGGDCGGPGGSGAVPTDTPGVTQQDHPGCPREWDSLAHEEAVPVRTDQLLWEQTVFPRPPVGRGDQW